MHIAFLTSEYVTESNFAGGLAQYLGRVTTGLVNRGHNVVVFVISEKSGELDYKGVLVKRIKTQRWWLLRFVNFILHIIKRPRLIESQQASSIAKGLDKALRKYSSKMRFDIIQAASWRATGLFVSKRPVAPVVVRVSSYEALLQEHRGSKLTADKRLSCFLERHSIRQANAVYAPSKFMAKEVTRRTGVTTRLVRPPFQYNNEISRSQTGIKEIDHLPAYLLYFGRISRYKGAETLLEAIEPLFSQIPDFNLVIVGPANGDDPAAKRLLSLAETMGESVHYAGVLANDDLVPVIERSRAVVLPSLMDNLPNTCLEAMSLGKVVIGPNGVSFDELIDNGKSGILFKTGDPVCLRESIARAWHLTDQERQSMGNAAKAKVAQIGSDITLSDLEKLYETVISS
jgi:glycosyltransferase involved in cell wall biosynthesis